MSDNKSQPTFMPVAKTEERKPALCRYCGGEVRIIICDDDGNIHGEEYLKEPYSGVGYMLAHDRSDVPVGVKCPICTQDDAIGSWIYDTEDDAYDAVTRAKPNLPLSKEQIGQMPRLAAVWVYFSPKYDPMIMSARQALSGFNDDTMCKHPVGSLFFAYPPTQADIESALSAKGGNQ